jgi:5'(3')-deoxyribonucleotidase
MKTLEQLRLVTEQDLPSIYCDMDGVLVDFVGGAERVGAKLPPESERANTTQDEKNAIWNKITSVKDFWANLSWMPGAKKLYQRISKYDAHILSAYAKRDSSSITGKRKWLKKNTNFKSGKINLVMRSQKKNFATVGGKSNILIDDYEKNIREWEAAGGVGIIHKNVNETIAKLNKLGFK